MSDEHQFDGLDQDAEGWDFCRCDCGWISPPCPDTETAVEFWGDHIMAEDTKGGDDEAALARMDALVAFTPDPPEDPT